MDKKQRFILYTISYLHIRVMLIIIKISLSYSYSACESREHPGSFQNKSVNSHFHWVSRCFLFFPKLAGKERPFWKDARRENTLQDYQLVDIRDEKVSHFEKSEIIIPLFCFLLHLLTNKHCMTWSSLINLWIDSRTCQK